MKRRRINNMRWKRKYEKTKQIKNENYVNRQKNMRFSILIARTRTKMTTVQRSCFIILYVIIVISYYTYLTERQVNGISFVTICKTFNFVIHFLLFKFLLFGSRVESFAREMNAWMVFNVVANRCRIRIPCKVLRPVCWYWYWHYLLLPTIGINSILMWPFNWMSQRTFIGREHKLIQSELVARLRQLIVSRSLPPWFLVLFCFLFLTFAVCFCYFIRDCHWQLAIYRLDISVDMLTRRYIWYTLTHSQR